jgi:hypothetical protein
MFSDYAERGRQFKQAVERIGRRMAGPPDGDLPMR